MSNHGGEFGYIIEARLFLNASASSHNLTVLLLPSQKSSYSSRDKDSSTDLNLDFLHEKNNPLVTHYAPQLYTSTIKCVLKTLPARNYSHVFPYICTEASKESLRASRQYVCYIQHSVRSQLNFHI